MNTSAVLVLLVLLLVLVLVAVAVAVAVATVEVFCHKCFIPFDFIPIANRFFRSEMIRRV
jgi:hypothetical protein